MYNVTPSFHRFSDSSSLPPPPTLKPLSLQQPHSPLNLPPSGLNTPCLGMGFGFGFGFVAICLMQIYTSLMVAKSSTQPMESPSENCSHFPIVTLGFSSPLTDLSSFFKWYLFRLFPQEVSYHSCSSVGNAFLACSILGVTATWGISPASDDEHNFCKYLEVSKSYI